MSLFQALDFQQAAITRLHSEDGKAQARLLATSAIGGQVFPIFWSFLDGRLTHGAMPLAATLAIGLALLIVRFREPKIEAMGAMLPPLLSSRARLVLVIVFVTVASITAMVAGVSALAALGVFLALTALPAHRFAVSRAAP